MLKAFSSFLPNIQFTPSNFSSNLPAVVYASNSNETAFRISLLSVLVSSFLIFFLPLCGDFSRNKWQIKWENMRKKQPPITSFFCLKSNFKMYILSLCFF